VHLGYWLMGEYVKPNSCNKCSLLFCKCFVELGGKASFNLPNLFEFHFFNQFILIHSFIPFKIP
jgi:hypothetical protein